MMTVKEFQVGVVCTNCFLAVNSDTKETLIIDPGDQAQMLASYIDQNQLHPVAVLLTHGHFDHCMAAEELARRYGILVYVHEDEKQTMENPAYNCCTMIGRNLVFHADHYFHGEKDHLSMAGFEIDVLHTPGHTVGGVCFYIESEKLLFSGDTLFYESVGRTDFPKGSMSQLVRSIQEKLFPLPNDTKVLPGHGEWTTIGNERQNNPFL
ncbi:MAG: MBL fold metallo-hydrolase [Eubacterium sp.]|nr:MBL fold metallo-hydrolase [Eubacterium sp.]